VDQERVQELCTDIAHVVPVLLLAALSVPLKQRPVELRRALEQRRNRELLELIGVGLLIGACLVTELPPGGHAGSSRGTHGALGL
jgi:hypothetical protein